MKKDKCKNCGKEDFLIGGYCSGICATYHQLTQHEQRPICEEDVITITQGSEIKKCYLAYRLKIVLEVLNTKRLSHDFTAPGCCNMSKDKHGDYISWHDVWEMLGGISK